MASILKQAFNGNQAQTTPDMQAMYQDFCKNPMSFLARARFNIPQNVGSSPEAIVRHLASTGQVPRQLMPQVQAMLNKVR